MKNGHVGLAMDISAAEFKAKCLKLLDEVAATGKPMVVTKRGKPVARVVPIEHQGPAPLFGFLKGTVVFHDDVISPIDVPWSAESDEEHGPYAPRSEVRR